MNYTKGEWKVYHEEELVTVDSDNEVVAVCRKKEWQKSDETALANAHLIAAAPDMYETLREVKLVWAGLDPNIRFPHLQEVIQQALAKAEGGK